MKKIVGIILGALILMGLLLTGFYLLGIVVNFIESHLFLMIPLAIIVFGILLKM